MMTKSLRDQFRIIFEYFGIVVVFQGDKMFYGSFKAHPNAYNKIHQLYTHKDKPTNDIKKSHKRDM